MKRSTRSIWFVLVLLILSVSFVHATPGCDCELEAGLVYIGGHQFRSLERHLCGKIQFRVLSGTSRVATGPVGLGHLILDRKRLFLIEELTVEVISIDTCQERLMASPRLYRYLTNNAAALDVGHFFDEGSQLSQQIARNIRRRRGPDDTIYEGYFRAGFSEQFWADGSREPISGKGLSIGCRPHHGLPCRRCF